MKNSTFKLPRANKQGRSESRQDDLEGKDLKPRKMKKM